MIEYKDTITKLNEILKKNDLSLVDEFSNEYKTLIKNFVDTQYFIDINENAIKYSYRLIVMHYGEKATLSHFSILLNNYNNKGEEIVKDFYELNKNNTNIEQKSSEISTWFLNDYYTGLKGQRGATKYYEHCYIVRFLSDFIAHQSLK